MYKAILLINSLTTTTKMELTNSQISIILKGICHSMLAMVKPSLTEINKMLFEFDMELIIKPTTYNYRGFPCNVGTWYVSGADTRPNGIGGGILEWCVNQSDAIEMLGNMEQFSHFSDLKVGNTEWLGIRHWESLTGREIEILYNKCLDKIS